MRAGPRYACRSGPVAYNPGYEFLNRSGGYGGRYEDYGLTPPGPIPHPDVAAPPRYNNGGAVFPGGHQHQMPDPYGQTPRGSGGGRRQQPGINVAKVPGYRFNGEGEGGGNGHRSGEGRQKGTRGGGTVRAEGAIAPTEDERASTRYGDEGEMNDQGVPFGSIVNGNIINVEEGEQEFVEEEEEEVEGEEEDGSIGGYGGISEERAEQIERWAQVVGNSAGGSVAGGGSVAVSVAGSRASRR